MALSYHLPRPFGLRSLAFAPPFGSPLPSTPWLLLQEERCNPAQSPVALYISTYRFQETAFLSGRTFCSHSVSGSFNSPFGVLFSFRSRYLCAIGLRLYLELEVDAPMFTPTTQWTLLCASPHPLFFAYEAFTLFGSAFQRTSARKRENGMHHISSKLPRRIRIASVWLSVALTNHIPFGFFSCGY